MLRENKGILYLNHFATSCAVVGGMGELLKEGKRYAKKRGCNTIVTFSDHCVSDGELYSKLDFIYDKEIAPDYKYIVNDERKHKFSYRLKRFRNDPDLRYVEGMTEKRVSTAQWFRAYLGLRKDTMGDGG